MVLKRGRIAKQYQQQFQQVACQAKRATRDGVQALAPGTSPTSRAVACRTQNQGRGAVGKEGFPPKFRRGAAPNLLQIMRVFWNRKGSPSKSF